LWDCCVGVYGTFRTIPTVESYEAGVFVPANFGNFSGQQQQQHMNKNSTENYRASAFNAFDGLSLTPTPTEIAPIARVNDKCTVSSNNHDDVSPTTTAAALLLEETTSMLQKH